MCLSLGAAGAVALLGTVPRAACLVVMLLEWDFEATLVPGRSSLAQYRLASSQRLDAERSFKVVLLGLFFGLVAYLRCLLRSRRHHCTIPVAALERAFDVSGHFDVVGAFSDRRLVMTGSWTIAPVTVALGISHLDGLFFAWLPAG